MASVTHVTLGLAAGRLYARDSRPAWPWMLFLAGLSMLPDADVIGIRFGYSLDEPLGHRGASHSLVIALVAGGLVAAIGRAAGARRVRLFVFATLVIASHGLLDTLTDGGRGVALLWPFTEARWHAPWTPIPVAPIGLVPFFTTARGQHCALVETIGTLPLIVYALWPRLDSEGP